MNDLHSNTRDEPEMFGALIGPPSTGWVVHQVTSVSVANEVWAWCKVRVDEPGYSEIHFTGPDGSSPADPGKGTLRLGPVITKVWC